jgi:hypothetical protein
MSLIQNIKDHPDVSDFAEAIARTGSRVICDPPPTDTDDDYVVLASRMWSAFDILDCLGDYGYIHNTGVSDAYHNMLSFDEEDGFMSFKKGEVNYIITPSQDFFDKFCAATLSAKEMNLTDKQDRIKHFRKYLYGEDL